MVFVSLGLWLCWHLIKQYRLRLPIISNNDLKYRHWLAFLTTMAQNRQGAMSSPNLELSFIIQILESRRTWVQILSQVLCLKSLQQMSLNVFFHRFKIRQHAFITDLTDLLFYAKMRVLHVDTTPTAWALPMRVRFIFNASQHFENWYPIELLHWVFYLGKSYFVPAILWSVCPSPTFLANELNNLHNS